MPDNRAHHKRLAVNPNRVGTPFGKMKAKSPQEDKQVHFLHRRIITSKMDAYQAIKPAPKPGAATPGLY